MTQILIFCFDFDFDWLIEFLHTDFLDEHLVIFTTEEILSHLDISGNVLALLFVHNNIDII